jgi:hypothetical protein
MYGIFAVPGFFYFAEAPAPGTRSLLRKNALFG